MEKRQKKKKEKKENETLEKSRASKLEAKKEFHCVKKQKQSYNLSSPMYIPINFIIIIVTHPTPTDMEIKINKWDLIKFKKIVTNIHL